MKPIWIDEKICYDGTQLRSHWIYRKTNAPGDAIASFIGPADVPLANMVDLADVMNSENIFSKSMLHFIIEHFDCDLYLAIARQRLLASIAKDEIASRTAISSIRRNGDDIYDGDRKLSVSIATASPVSSLIHFAINIESEGTPVATRGLADYRIDPRSFSDAVVKAYISELSGMETARCKVRSVL